MALLALDTCLSALTIAIETDGGTVVSISEEIGVGHAEQVAPRVRALLEEARVEASALTRIGVTIGPGSFMGQRVGIAFAKGLAMGSGAETVPMTTLEAVAEGQNGPTTVLLDARRRQVYAQRFGEDGMATEPPHLLSYEEGKARLERGDDALGTGVLAVDPDRAPPPRRVPDAAALLALTRKKPAAPLQTLYLRAPDAKPPSSAPL
ncbi:MAG: tRNA (adenosine(37)-N6)-threonylcarbamoyltransferase complex dimerization subunit type 1 TsaB [Pseudomonadota bacterium]